MRVCMQGERAHARARVCGVGVCARHLCVSAVCAWLRVAGRAAPRRFGWHPACLKCASATRLACCCTCRYHGVGVAPFHNYPLSCYVLDAPPAPPPSPPPPPPNMTACATALDLDGIASQGGNASEAATVMALGQDLDRILLTDKHFLMAAWIEAARAFGNSTDERLWLEWNARVQVTSWGSIESNGNTITDYASKQWVRGPRPRLLGGGTPTFISLGITAHAAPR